MSSYDGACVQAHIDLVERKRWNACKLAYRKSHPTENRNFKYYENVRNVYKEQGVSTLSTWLKHSDKEDNHDGDR